MSASLSPEGYALCSRRGGEFFVEGCEREAPHLRELEVGRVVGAQVARVCQVEQRSDFSRPRWCGNLDCDLGQECEMPMRSFRRGAATADCNIQCICNFKRPHCGNQRIVRFHGFLGVDRHGRRFVIEVPCNGDAAVEYEWH